MDHPFEHRAHYNSQGEPCHCPWGHDEGGEHLGSVKESSKFDWLQGRPDMQTPEGKNFLRYMKDGGYAKAADKLLPWIAREWEKGRIALPHNHEYEPDKPLKYGERSSFPLEHEFTPYEAERTQKNLEEMSKRRQGVDVMQHKIHELMPKVQNFQDWKDSQGRDEMGETLHTFPDGWTVRRLQNPGEYADEGDRMGHCLGDGGGQNQYSEAGANGSKIHVSLRDHKNLPHATMELEPAAWGGGVDPDTSINEFYGKQDSPPMWEYQERMREWLEPHGVPFEWEENPEAALWQEEHGGEPVTAATAHRPLYYRWIYSPSKGVTLGSNLDDHPALVKYHSELGGDINDTDLVHGYASALDGGWRITDLEHQPVEDPYIVQQVVRRLNHEDGPQIHSEGSWQPSKYDWERLHYALPCEEVVMRSD